MSEHQYYEFLAVDKPLGEREQKALRAISTRAHITATSFTNTYNWGDLKADPQSMLMRYFDAFVYVANWGTHQFAVRLPSGAVDVKALSRYRGGCVTLMKRGNRVLVDFCAEEVESDGWEEGEGWMTALAPLRADILSGDLRSLYLGWLLSAQSGDLEDDVVSPPVPPGLSNLSGSLSSLVEFLDMDPDLVSAAAKWSAGGNEDSFSQEDFSAWVLGFPLSEKDSILKRIVEGDDLHLRPELLKRFREERRMKTAAHDGATDGRLPTVAELLRATDALREERKRKEAERRGRESKKREKKAAAERKKYLAALASRQDRAWEEVENLIGMKQGAKYEAAVRLLKDLHDVSVSQGAEAACISRIRSIRDRHERKPAFIGRLDKAGFPAGAGSPAAASFFGAASDQAE